MDADLPKRRRTVITELRLIDINNFRIYNQRLLFSYRKCNADTDALREFLLDYTRHKNATTETAHELCSDGSISTHIAMDFGKQWQCKSYRLLHFEDHGPEVRVIKDARAWDAVVTHLSDLDSAYDSAVLAQEASQAGRHELSRIEDLKQWQLKVHALIEGSLSSTEEVFAVNLVFTHPKCGRSTLVRILQNSNPKRIHVRSGPAINYRTKQSNSDSKMGRGAVLIVDVGYSKKGYPQEGAIGTILSEARAADYASVWIFGDLLPQEMVEGRYVWNKFRVRADWSDPSRTSTLEVFKVPIERIRVEAESETSESE